MAIRDAAEYSRYSQGYIVQKIKEGEIKGEMLGNFWTVDKDSFEAWLAKKGGPRKRKK